MSFLGHPVCHLGLNWCILLGLFIVFFQHQLKCSCCLCFLWETYRVHNAFQNQILQMLPIGITGYYLEFWGHYTVYFHILSTKCFLFAITAYFLSFPDKKLWFSSQRRREGVVGDANGSISKNNVLYLFPLFFSKSQLLF